MLLHAYDRLRGGGYSFFTIGLDTMDPLAEAMRGLLAQPTDVTALVGRIVASGSPRSLGDEPLHFDRRRVATCQLDPTVMMIFPAEWPSAR